MSSFSGMFSGFFSGTTNRHISYRPFQQTMDIDTHPWRQETKSIILKQLQRKDPENYQRLNQAIKAESGVCVPIRATKDRRLQVNRVKRYPHLIYCNVFRWPDLTSHLDLTSKPICLYPFANNLKKICVNPYHYDRIPLPPTPMPRYEVARPVGDNLEAFLIPKHAPFMPQIAAPKPDGPEVWGSIRYFEENSRVGDPYFCRSDEICVDGYTNPNSSDFSFSLGSFVNHRRNEKIEKTRLHIGRGIQIFRMDDAVYVKCLSHKAVFVQSQFGNQEMDYHLTTVCKLMEGAGMMIFDYKVFENMVQERKSEGYESVHSLRRFCTTRVSFVKGWGKNYRRIEVTSTPCWMEITFHAPLQWIDEALRQLGPPDSAITSFS